MAQRFAPCASSRGARARVKRGSAGPPRGHWSNVGGVRNGTSGSRGSVAEFAPCFASGPGEVSCMRFEWFASRPRPMHRTPFPNERASSTHLRTFFCACHSCQPGAAPKNALSAKSELAACKTLANADARAVLCNDTHENASPARIQNFRQTGFLQYRHSASILCVFRSSAPRESINRTPRGPAAG